MGGLSRGSSLTRTYLVHQSMELSLKKSIELAHVAQEHARTTEDHKEAVQAFLEKRRPAFKGR